MHADILQSMDTIQSLYSIILFKHVQQSSKLFNSTIINVNVQCLVHIYHYSLNGNTNSTIGAVLDVALREAATIIETAF
jgi:hypothetical protein